MDVHAHSLVERNQAGFLEEWNDSFDRCTGGAGGEAVTATEDALTADLTVGRTITAPLA